MLWDQSLATLGFSDDDVRHDGDRDLRLTAVIKTDQGARDSDASILSAQLKWQIKLRSISVKVL